jgi:hypothetical protein
MPQIGPFGDVTLSKTACAADLCFFVEVPAPRGLFGGGGPNATEFTSVASKQRTGERRAVDVDVGRDFGERERLRESCHPSVMARLRRSDTIKTEIEKIEQEITHDKKHSKVTTITKHTTTPSNLSSGSSSSAKLLLLSLLLLLLLLL